MKTLKTLIIVLVAMLMPGYVFAQERYLDVTSFRVLQTDMDARIQAPVEDQNGEKCALIKVTSNVKGLTFESPSMGIVKQEENKGEIWVYIPAESRSVSIFHSDFPPFRNYMYPVKIESATVYEMKITGHRESEGTVSTNAQMLTINVQPSSASLFIDEEEMPMENGLFTAMMPKGTHTYRIQAKDYEPTSGSIDLGESQWVRSIRLKEKFGFINITSYPEAGANVFINDKLMGQTPFKSENLDPMNYKVRVEKEFFFPQDTVATVNTGGEITELVFNMVSTIKPKEPRKTFVMLDGALGTGNHASFGAMVGMVGKAGGYLHLRTDFGTTNTDVDCNNDLIVGNDATPSYATGNTQKSRLSITGGYVQRFTLNNPFKKGGMGGIYGYVGAGYGQRTYAVELTDGRWAKNTDRSQSGVAAEIGGICRMGSIGVSLGYHTVNFKYHEAMLGLGVFF